MADRTLKTIIVVVTAVVVKIVVLRMLLSPCFDVKTHDAAIASTAFQMFYDTDGVVELVITCKALPVALLGVRIVIKDVAGIVARVGTRVGMLVAHVLGQRSAYWQARATVTHILQTQGTVFLNTTYLAFVMNIFAVRNQVFGVLEGVIAQVAHSVVIIVVLKVVHVAGEEELARFTPCSFVHTRSPTVCYCTSWSPEIPVAELAIGVRVFADVNAVAPSHLYGVFPSVIVCIVVSQCTIR
jgi:hypothetical protein